MALYDQNLVCMRQAWHFFARVSRMQQLQSRACVLTLVSSIPHRLLVSDAPRRRADRAAVLMHRPDASATRFFYVQYARAATLELGSTTARSNTAKASLFSPLPSQRLCLMLLLAWSSLVPSAATSVELDLFLTPSLQDR